MPVTIYIIYSYGSDMIPAVDAPTLAVFRLHQKSQPYLFQRLEYIPRIVIIYLVGLFGPLVKFKRYLIKRFSPDLRHFDDLIQSRKPDIRRQSDNFFVTDDAESLLDRSLLVFIVYPASDPAVLIYEKIAIFLIPFVLHFLGRLTHQNIFGTFVDYLLLPIDIFFNIMYIHSLKIMV